MQMDEERADQAKKNASIEMVEDVDDKVETLYQAIAKIAFAFCVIYQRKTEFRKLCQTVRHQKNLTLKKGFSKI